MLLEIDIIEPHGFCGNENGFGVTRAVALATQTATKYPGKVYMLGEIVHNQHVVDQLEHKHGIKTVACVADLPDGAVVIIRSHGTTLETRKALEEEKFTIIDATCPLVANAHRDVVKYAQEGKTIIYIASDIDHDEAVGVASEAPDKVIITTLDKILGLEIKYPEKTVILTQTTLSVLDTKDILQVLKEKYPELTIKPHICMATTQRQAAVIEAAHTHTLIIIVGSPTSSNSNRLREVAEKTGARAYIVDNSTDLEKSWFIGHKSVAVSSGASTAEETFLEVVEKIRHL